VTEDDIRDEGPTMVTTVRLGREQHDRLREIAALEHRTMAGEIRRLIYQRIEDFDFERATALD